jgi:hypothetical protein
MEKEFGFGGNIPEPGRIKGRAEVCTTGQGQENGEECCCLLLTESLGGEEADVSTLL